MSREHYEECPLFDPSDGWVDCQCPQLRLVYESIAAEAEVDRRLEERYA